MLSEVSVAGLLGMSESSSYSLDPCGKEKSILSLILPVGYPNMCSGPRAQLKETTSMKFLAGGRLFVASELIAAHGRELNPTLYMDP